MVVKRIHRHKLCSLLLIALILSILGSSAVLAADGGPFAELPAGHWCYQALDRLFALGLISNDTSGYRMNNHCISRYELAVWVKSAIESIDHIAKKDVSLVANLGPRYWNLNELFDAYLISGAPNQLTSEDIQQIIELVNLVQPELEMLGQRFNSPGSGLFTSFLEGKSQSLSMNEVGLGMDNNLAAFTLPTSLGSRSILYAVDSNDKGLLSPSEPEQNEAAFGVAVNVGDVQLTAGRTHYRWSGSSMETITSLGLSYPFGQDASVSANVATMFSEDLDAAGGLQAATALGLGLRLPKIKVKLNYALQGVSDKTDASAIGSTKLTASAGFGYQLAPTSEASAGFSITGNIGQPTTANFGLRYTMNAASLSLGYQLASSGSAGEQTTEKNTTNMASAEFTIRF